MTEKKTAAPKSVKSVAEAEPIAEPSTDTAPVNIPEAGAIAINEEFSASVSPRGVVSIKQVGWVGDPQLVVSAFKIPALIAVLQELVSPPSAPEDDA